MKTTVISKIPSALLLVLFSATTPSLTHTITHHGLKTHTPTAMAIIGAALAHIPDTVTRKKIILQSWHGLSLFVHCYQAITNYFAVKTAVTNLESSSTVKKRLLAHAHEPGMQEYVNRIELAENLALNFAKKANINIRAISFSDKIPPLALHTFGGANNATILLSLDWLTDEEALFNHLEAALAHEVAHAKLRHNALDRIAAFTTAVGFDVIALGKNVSKKGYLTHALFQMLLKKQIDNSIKRCCEFTADAYAAKWTSVQQTTEMLAFLQRKTTENNTKKNLMTFLQDSTSSHPELHRRIAYLKQPGLRDDHPLLNPFCYAWW